jgi:tetratricopeptide (TPR) repeat protein
MAEQSNLLQVFENILSSQSFELLHHFSNDESWSGLSAEERELLAQLFLLSAEASSQTGETEEVRRRALLAYRTACRLAPGSARNWYRLGAYLALGEQETDLTEAITALKQAVELDSGFFDAHYALGCARLRLGALKGEDSELVEADLSFAKANTLVSSPEGSSAPAEFYWHWGIIWFLRSRSSGEPVDLKKCLEYFELARVKGLARAHFFNDFGNATVEMALLTSNDSIVHDAISLYLAAIEASGGSADEGHEKAVRLFNIGCCYQHLFDLSREQRYFESAEQAFTQATALSPELSAVWQRWGLLLFQAFRFRSSSQTAQDVVKKLKAAEEQGAVNAITLAVCAQALLWTGRDLDDLTILAEAEQYATRAMTLDRKDEGPAGHHPEVWAAAALCQFEYGYYFQDRSRFVKALSMLQEALAEHPKSALLWHLLGLLKVADSEMTNSEKTLREALVSYHLASQSTYADTPMFWNDWGIALLTLADVTEEPSVAQEAIAKFETAYERLPDALAPWSYNLARAYDLLGEIIEDETSHENAIFMLVEILYQDPNCTHARQQLALSYLHYGELEESVYTFRASVEAFEAYLREDPEDEYSWADYGLALIYLGLQEKSPEALPKEWFSAEEALIQALSLGNDQACYYLASLYSLMGNFVEAIQFLEAALKRNLLPPLAILWEDPWFEPLAKTVAFREFVMRVLSLHREEDQVLPDSGSA